MITDCPHLRDSQSAMMRGITSAVPPAGKGTTIFTVRVGKSCACAGMVTAPSASTKAGSIHPKRRDDTARFFDIMLLLLMLKVLGGLDGIAAELSQTVPQPPGRDTATKRLAALPCRGAVIDANRVLP